MPETVTPKHVRHLQFFADIGESLWFFADRVFKVISWLGIVALIELLYQKTGLKVLEHISELGARLAIAAAGFPLFVYAIRKLDAVLALSEQGGRTTQALVVVCIAIPALVLMWWGTDQFTAFLELIIAALTLTAT